MLKVMINFIISQLSKIPKILKEPRVLLGLGIFGFFAVVSKKAWNWFKQSDGGAKKSKTLVLDKDMSPQVEVDEDMGQWRTLTFNPSIDDLGNHVQWVQEYDDTEANYTRRVIILAGPGGRAFDKKNVWAMQTAFKKQGAMVEVIGDGESSITASDITLALSAQKQITLPTTVVITSHGEQINGVHHMDMGEGNSVPSYQILNLFTNAIDARVDFFSTFCHGGGALTRNVNLKEGTIVVLSPATAVTSGFDVDRFVAELNKNEKIMDLSALGLLKFYLSSALKNRIAPLIADKHGIKDLSKAFCSLLTNPITDLEKAIVYQELSTILERKEIDRLLTIISSGKELGIYAEDYGVALLISLVLNRGISEFPEYQHHEVVPQRIVQYRLNPAY